MNEALAKDKLLKLWRRSYDENLLIAHINEGGRKLDYISEGLHNKVYRWKNQGFSFAVFKAKSAFYEESN